jgi:signal transduction histidine kinase/GAF domain-containing protein
VKTNREIKAKRNTATREESAIIERIARIVSSVRGSKPDYPRLAAELEQAIPFDIFGVVLLRHDREAVRVTVCEREADAWRAKYHQHPCAGSRLESILHYPELQVKDYPNGLDGSPAESGDALSGKHQLRSIVIAPLLIEDRVLGTLELGSVFPGTYDDEALQRLINAVAHVLASAIESAQSSGSAEMQDRQRQALKDVSSALASKVELPDILNQLVEGIAKALQVTSAVLMINVHKDQICLEAQSGFDPQQLQSSFDLCWPLNEKCIIGESLLQQQVRISQDISKDERYPISQQIFREFHIRSVCSYPLVTGNAIYGVLLLCSTEPGGFTPLKVDIFSLFASQATVAIHNSMLLEAAQQRSRFQEAIARLEQAHQRTTSAPWGSPIDSVSNSEEHALHTEYEMLRRLREETQQTFGVSFGSLLRFMSDHLLTLHERDVHAILQIYGEEQALRGKSKEESLEGEDDPSVAATGNFTSNDALTQTVELLSHTAEVAVLGTDMLGELSQLLLQLQHTTTNGIKDAWFVVDMQGSCVYMNPVAETLCDTKLLHIRKERTAKIENLFARLLPRVRNGEEIASYLQSLGKTTTYLQELQAIVAPEPVHQEYLQSPERGAGKKENSTLDYYYQFKCYPLYNQQGYCTAHALQVHDRTEQVRDENNRSALLSAVSHDLRTPLAAIKAAVSGLLEEGLCWNEEDRHEILEDIEGETDHLTVLVDALVEMSRIEMGALSLEKEWCDLVEVLYRALAKIERVLGSMTIKLEAQKELPLVYGDYVQLERVFFYLLENVERHGQREIEVSLKTVMMFGGVQMLQVAVTDPGRKVIVEEHEHLFSTYTADTSGTNGLGLAICKGIIEAHQGEIVVESTAEGGTRFVFLLPAHPSTVVKRGAGKSGAQGSVMHQVGMRDSEEQAGEKQ